MRAVVLRAGRLEVRETPDPVPGSCELLIRTVSTAICASDVHFMDHRDAVPAGGPAGMVYDPDRDIVLGHEFVGEVVAHGPDCTDAFPVGTRVTAMPILLVDGGMDVTISGGYAVHEFEMFGVPVEERAARMTRLFGTLKQAWTGNTFDFEGRTAKVTPAPYRDGGPPLTMGGSSAGAAKRAARIANAFQPSGPAFWEDYVEECAKLGKPDPGPLLTADNQTVYIAEDVEAAWEELGPYFLHESTSYGTWGEAAGVAVPYKVAKDPDELRETGLYRIVTPDELVDELQAMGSSPSRSCTP